MLPSSNTSLQHPKTQENGGGQNCLGPNVPQFPFYSFLYLLQLLYSFGFTNLLSFCMTCSIYRQVCADGDLLAPSLRLVLLMMVSNPQKNLPPVKEGGEMALKIICPPQCSFDMAALQMQCTPNNLAKRQPISHSLAQSVNCKCFFFFHLQVVSVTSD